MKKRLISGLKDQRGVTVIVVAIVITMLIGFAALAIDIGYTLVTRNELQNTADAAALAATRKLGSIYEGMSYQDQQTYVCDPTTIVPVAKEVALKNRAAGKNIAVNADDVIIGQWDGKTKTLTQTLNQPDAVKVIARRETGTNGPITTFFAMIFGVDTVSVTTSATAALTGESTKGPGGLPLPAAINKSWVQDPDHCNSDLTFHPSSAGTCSAWHAYNGNDYRPSASIMRAMINAIAAGTYSSPETIAGQTLYEFTNGTLASLFTSTAIQDLFDVMRKKNDGILDMDTSDATWTTGVPIFDDTVEGCNPNGYIKIVGFATIIITGVSGPPETTISATLKCDNVVWGRGSGGNYGTKGSIPGLVQ